MTRRCSPFRAAGAVPPRWWTLLLVAALWPLPLPARAAGLPGGRVIPVPRALLHADGDGNRIYDDLDTRLERADPAAASPVLVLFQVPLERIDLNALQRRVGSFAVTARFPREAGLAARLTPAQVRALAALPQVAHIEGDDWLSVTREASQAGFGVTKARNDFQFTGDGDGALDSFSAADHTIAVIDTGIDGGHADFAGGKIIGWMDLVNGEEAPYDDVGHGTHVASIAAGLVRDGVGGVAPGAALVGVKVINKDGNARTSDVVKAINWCLDQQSDLGIRIINISLSGTGSSDGTDIMSVAIQKCVEAGIVVCVAASNHGPATYTIPAPGAAPDAITVGTMRDPARGGFALWTTSGRGPTADGRIKPDIVAPGYQIVAAKAGTATDTMPLTGSSMAAPFVAGVCALMLEANPDLKPDEVKQILRRTAIDFGPAGEDIDYGAGRLDAYAAIREAKSPGDPEAGEGPPVPDHRFFSGSLDANGSDEWKIEVSSTQDPIAAVLILPDWTSSNASRFQLQLRDPDGQIVANSVEPQRDQLITFQPTRTGTYTLRIDAAIGQGAYFLDVSFGAPGVGLGSRH